MKKSFMFAIAAFFVMIISILPVMYLTVIAKIDLDQIYTTLIGQLIEVIIIVVFVTVIGKWNSIGLQNRIRPISFLYMLPLIFIIVLQLSGGIKTHSASRFIAMAILAMIAGFCEEIMFRGIIFTSLRKHGAVPAIVISSVLFGLAHSVNIFIGFDYRAILSDLLLTASIGLIFAATFEFSGSLLPLIVVHTLINFSSYISSDTIMTEKPASYNLDSIIPGLILSAILIIWGSILITRKKKMKNRIV